MAERRMFAKTVIDSDAFLDMPQSSQLLYFHLCMRADDEGFINKPKSIMRLAGSKEDDLKVLFMKGFVIPFESGVIVIKHWKLHNYIRGDRLKSTVYTDEKAQLTVKSNNSYSLKSDDVSQMSVTCQSSGSIGKVSIGKDSIGKDSDMSDKPTKHKHGEYKNVLLTDDELENLKSEYTDYASRIERLSEYIASTGKQYKSHYATIKAWARKDQTKAIKPNVSYSITDIETKFNNF